jgi:RNA polymerase sigma-70 factor (ECF subfamily)
MSPRAAEVPHGAEWMARIRTGDEAVFETLFRTFAPGLCSFLTRYVGERAIAEELVQDVFLSLWDHRATVHITGSVQAYLFAAARNRALNHIDHERVTDRFRVSVLSRMTVSDASVQGEAECFAALGMQEALARLPARCRLVFTLQRTHGMSYGEVASALAISVKTVEVHMGRALRTLRAWYAEQADLPIVTATPTDVGHTRPSAGASARDIANPA